MPLLQVPPLLLVVAAEAAAAYLVLDLIFRTINVKPAALRQSLRRGGLWYTLMGLTAVTLGFWVLRRTSPFAPHLGTAISTVVWWVLWRFGLRKQFPFLFGARGGTPERKKPNS